MLISVVVTDAQTHAAHGFEDPDDLAEDECGGRYFSALFYSF
jgi:hypothetical protein